MTQEEEILIRLGIDTTSMRAGTNAALDLQKKASLEYVGFWESAMAKKTAAESAANDKSIAAARAVAKAKIEIAEAEAARIIAINEGIAAAGAGGGGFGGAGRTAQDVRDANGLERDAEIIGGVGAGASGAAYAFDKAGKLLGKIGEDGKLIKGVETAAEGLVKVGHEAGSLSTVMRESMVIVREGLRGNWTRMAGSFTILIGAIGSVVGVALAIVAAADAAFELLGGNGMYRHIRDFIKAKAGEKESGESLKKAEENTAEMLRKRVEDLQRAGAISEKDATMYMGKLKSGTNEDINFVLGATNPLIKNQSAEDQVKTVEKEKEIARIKEQERKAELAAQRELMGHQEKMNSLTKEWEDLRDEIAKLDKDSVAYAQKSVELHQLEKQVAQERIEQAKEAAELQKEYDADEKDIAKIQRKISQIDVQDALPTIEDLAGKSYTDELNSAYGPAKWKKVGRGRFARWVKTGGEFDLSAGDGPFAQAAQEAELAKKQEQWDIIHGNAQWQYNPVTGENELIGGQALEDRSRRVAAENLLSRAGLETPEMKAAKMNQDIADINVKIGVLLDRASHDGIVIKTNA